MIQDAEKEHGKEGEQEVAAEIFRNFFEEDLFFIVYFVVVKPVTPEDMALVNHPFVINACREVGDGPKDMTIDIWAREHFKSTIITIAETLQFFAKEPEEGCCIISATRNLAKDFVRSLLETMQKEGMFLNTLFPGGGFWFDPEKEAKLWSVIDGAKLRRKSTAPTPSLFAAGLEDGMPTGKHFKRVIFDDIVNADIAESPPRMNVLKKKFDAAQNVGKHGGHKRVVGTIYHYADPVIYIRDKKAINTEDPLWEPRVKPATVDGSRNGKPVLLSQRELDIKKTESTYPTQQLCDPTPEEDRKLEGELVKDISPKDIPQNIIKLMACDPAGDINEGKGDNWATFVVGVSPNTDDYGASDFYILDGDVSQMPEAAGPALVSDIYMRNGRIQALGIEKVALSTTEIHVEKALQKRGRRVSVKAKNMIILKTRGRSKVRRIVDSWAWPLANGKIHISTAIPRTVRDWLRRELDQFPYGETDDIIDILAYIFGDMMADRIVKSTLKTHAPKSKNPYRENINLATRHDKDRRLAWMVS
jgi:hypothetical protein